MDDTHSTRPDPTRPITRRTVLTGVTVAGLAAVAGCLDDSDDPVSDPITIEPEMACDNCTMEIGNYRGPAGQSFYDEPEPILETDEDRPAQFCSSRCTYGFTFDHESQAEPTVVYLTDYSSVDWEVVTGGDAPEISRHLDAETFADPAELTLVVDSDVHGAMGRSLIGFSDPDDAESFQDEHGGDRYEHDEITPELLQSLMG
ncbi:nitrous oxide reductase accessory protein NosL [Halovivax gelatinilyticus]|uniref:nitrous oxide reductase accessory protein NosL n=1 Tax=Halovivax gelatinilyticus TaxID=2961597 RepID=UPI0020CA9602|nr:nitrous oxide reductase accessory protein NosL [Halovivax gelatinilyticus]